MAALDQSRPGRASSKSGHVRDAPKAEVISKMSGSATGRCGLMVGPWANIPPMRNRPNSAEQRNDAMCHERKLIQIDTINILRGTYRRLASISCQQRGRNSPSLSRTYSAGQRSRHDLSGRSVRRPLAECAPSYAQKPNCSDLGSNGSSSLWSTVGRGGGDRHVAIHWPHCSLSILYAWC